MTCTEVEACIDGLPRPAFSTPAPGEVRRHMERCIRCQGVGGNLEKAESRLRSLAEPTPGAAVSAAILARLAREIESRSPRPDPRPDVVNRPASTGGWSWVALYLGSIPVMAALGYKAVSGGGVVESIVAPVLSGIDGFSALPAWPVDLLFLLGATVYFVGLFGSAHRAKHAR